MSAKALGTSAVRADISDDDGSEDGADDGISAAAEPAKPISASIQGVQRNGDAAPAGKGGAVASRAPATTTHNLLLEAR